MKKVIALFVLIFTVSFAAQAQEKVMKDKMVKKITLEQTQGEFTQKQLTVSGYSNFFNNGLLARGS